MASYDLWNYIAIGAFVIAGLFLVITAIIFFKSHIPSVIAVLTGKAQKKDIVKIKENIENERGGRVQYFDKAEGKPIANNEVIGEGKFARPKQPAEDKVAEVKARKKASVKQGSNTPKPAKDSVVVAPEKHAKQKISGKTSKDLSVLKLKLPTDNESETDILVPDDAETMLLEAQPKAPQKQALGFELVVDETVTHVNDPSK